MKLIGSFQPCHLQTRHFPAWKSLRLGQKSHGIGTKQWQSFHSTEDAWKATNREYTIWNNVHILWRSISKVGYGTYPFYPPVNWCTPRCRRKRKACLKKSALFVRDSWIFSICKRRLSTGCLVLPDLFARGYPIVKSYLIFAASGQVDWPHFGNLMLPGLYGWKQQVSRCKNSSGNVVWLIDTFGIVYISWSTISCGLLLHRLYVN